MLRNNLGNNSDSKNEDGSVFSQTEHNIVATYLIMAGMISILSNIIVLGIFIKYKELRTPTNAIIINLAVTDIGVSSIGYPMSAASDLYGSWKFGYAGCQVVLEVEEVEVVASEEAEEVVVSEQVYRTPCYWAWQILFLLQMSVIMICMFLVAWSPYSIVCLWASFGDPKKIPPSVAIIAPLFAKSSTFYNPCIYVVANKKFRRAMFAMFKCQTHQAMPVTSVLPMDVSQHPLASGRT
ncbi:PREDICTED: visual pigment-like receptor peropsin [Propithecus coquereli]|uniref:visual pigment-like receptor peropsin n=1 Tax=Propithecus coquereli TaxID=379532 RepID=UPI00063F1D16|nr:PREDICTED: visual pigment-like receptor peropsin [Propithecus coquereli]